MAKKRGKKAVKIGRKKRMTAEERSMTRRIAARAASRLKKAQEREREQRAVARRQKMAERLAEEQRLQAEVMINTRLANYQMMAKSAVTHGELEEYFTAVLNAAVTHGDIDDNVLNESVGMIHWLIRQVRAKRQARNLPHSQIPIMADRRPRSLDEDDVDDFDDPFEGERRIISGDRTFP